MKSIMKVIKEIKPNGIYVFSGRSNANSCFIEKLIHAKSFLVYANYFLKGYLKIYDYLITMDGWVMVVKINSKQSILQLNYDGQIEVRKLISERMRLFLSTFVRVTNNEKSRTGALVHSSYNRFCFESKTEALIFIDKLRKQQLKLYSGRKKYRGLKTHYKIDSQVGKGSIFLCSRDLMKTNIKLNNIGEVLNFLDFENSVLQKMIDFTKINQFHKSPYKITHFQT